MLKSEMNLDVVAKEMGYEIPGGWTIKANVIPEVLTSPGNPHDYSYNTSDRDNYGKTWVFGLVMVTLTDDDGLVFASTFSEVIGIGDRQQLSYVGLHNNAFMQDLVKAVIRTAKSRLAKMQAIRIGGDNADNETKVLGSSTKRRIRSTGTRRPRAKVAATTDSGPKK